MKNDDQNRNDEKQILIDGDRFYDRISNILVVDDDNTLLKFFKIHLNKFFSRVVVVKNAKEAIEAMRVREIDLVISDIRMPRMDGLQLMGRVRRHDVGIPVMLISGGLLTDTEIAAVEAEADGFLRKPFSVDELHAFLDKGMAMREKYVRLGESLQDKTQIRKLLLGRTKLENLIKPDVKIDAVKALLRDIRKAG
jgi:DNA-binding NtrC family response regulator